jgi:hypothetical protein
LRKKKLNEYYLSKCLATIRECHALKDRFVAYLFKIKSGWPSLFYFFIILNKELTSSQFIKELLEIEVPAGASILIVPIYN